MLTVTFAFVVVTSLLLAMKSTRWVGAAGVFVLLCVAPVLASLLLIAIAVVCYFLFGTPTWDGIRKRLRWRD